MIVLGCDHAGLKQPFQKLENEIRRALGRIEDPRMVAKYLDTLQGASMAWLYGRDLPVREK